MKSVLIFLKQVDILTKDFHKSFEYVQFYAIQRFRASAELSEKTHKNAA